LRILVSQRVTLDPSTGERRDALDHRWPKFLALAGITTIAAPNEPSLVESLFRDIEPGGILLTGGNDLVGLGGDAPERDLTEEQLIEGALERELPLLGVCRGMQMLQHYYGVPLNRVDGHVTPRQDILFQGTRITVNSYHRFGTRSTVPELQVCAIADDGVIKAVRAGGSVLGIMWHPERWEPFRREDVSLFQEFFF